MSVRQSIAVRVDTCAEQIAITWKDKCTSEMCLLERQQRQSKSQMLTVTHDVGAQFAHTLQE